MLPLAGLLLAASRPGDIVFVPAGTPHHVQSMEPSISLSANFYSLSDVPLALPLLRVEGLRDARLLRLADGLEAALAA